MVAIGQTPPIWWERRMFGEARSGTRNVKCEGRAEGDRWLLWLTSNAFQVAVATVAATMVRFCIIGRRVDAPSGAPYGHHRENREDSPENRPSRPSRRSVSLGV